MSIPTKDSNRSYTGSGLESLSQLLQALVLVNPASVVNSQLTFLTTEKGLATWHLKKVTVEPPWD